MKLSLDLPEEELGQRVLGDEGDDQASRWGNSFYLNFLINSKIDSYSNIVIDIAKIKSRNKGRLSGRIIKDALFFEGLR